MRTMSIYEVNSGYCTLLLFAVSGDELELKKSTAPRIIKNSIHSN